MGELVFVGLDGGVVAPDQSGCLPVVFEIWGAAWLPGYLGGGLTVGENQPACGPAPEKPHVCCIISCSLKS